jgi:hypothetical protein
VFDFFRGRIASCATLSEGATYTPTRKNKEHIPSDERDANYTVTISDYTLCFLLLLCVAAVVMLVELSLFVLGPLYLKAARIARALYAKCVRQQPHLLTEYRQTGPSPQPRMKASAEEDVQDVEFRELGEAADHRRPALRPPDINQYP